MASTPRVSLGFAETAQADEEHLLESMYFPSKIGASVGGGEQGQRGAAGVGSRAGDQRGGQTEADSRQWQAEQAGGAEQGGTGQSRQEREADGARMGAETGEGRAGEHGQCCLSAGAPLRLPLDAPIKPGGRAIATLTSPARGAGGKPSWLCQHYLPSADSCRCEYCAEVRFCHRHQRQRRLPPPVSRYRNLRAP